MIEEASHYNHGMQHTKSAHIAASNTKPTAYNTQTLMGVRALAQLDLFPFLSLFSLYGLSYCMPKLTSLISYCALS